jgi:phage terminase small subunit
VKRKLTAKQRLFADEYIKSGNAAQSAIKAGYSAKTARSIGQENLTKPDIKAYIDAKMAEIESKKIATAKEVMEFYTRVLRNEELEDVVVVTPEGAETVQRKPQFKDKISVAKEIMKRYPLTGSDPVLAEQLRKVRAEADITEWKAKELRGDNDSKDKTTLVDDIGGDDNDGD